MKERRNLLKTERLQLKAFSGADRETLLRLAADPAVRATYMTPDLTDPARAEAFFLRMQALSAAPDRFVWGIYAGDALIGMLNECGAEADWIELGYFIDPALWGRGYATEALRAAIGELFRMGWAAVRAGYFEGNAASRRVMEKCGMAPIPVETVIPWLGADRRCLFMEIRRSASRA